MLESPLHLAAHIGLAGWVAQLLHPSFQSKFGQSTWSYKKRRSSETSPLFLATVEGYIDIVKLLLENGANPNWGEGSKGSCYTPLHQAVADSNSDIVRMLLDFGADPNAKCYPRDIKWPQDYCVSPIHWVETSEICTLLLDRGANIESETENSETALHFATEAGLLEVVTTLLSRKANPSPKTGDGNTPLATAIENNNVQIAQVLIKHNADVLCVGPKLRQTAFAGRFDTIEALREPILQRNPGYASFLDAIRDLAEYPASKPDLLALNLEEEECTELLELALRNGQVHSVRFLVDEQAGGLEGSVFDEGDRPLHIAASIGSEHIARLLMNEYKAESNATNRRGQTPLHVAVERGHEQIVRLFVNEYNGDLTARDSDSRTLLHIAAKYTHERVVRFLVDECMVDPIPLDNENQTPLHLLGAFRISSDAAVPNIVKTISQAVFKRYGTDMDCCDKAGNTPLYGELRGDWSSGVEGAVASALLEIAKVNPNARNTEGETSLHIALRRDKYQATSVLLDAPGTNPNIQDQSGNTPLHKATQTTGTYVYTNVPHYWVIRMLLDDPRVDVNTRNHLGETPLHLITASGSIEIARALHIIWPNLPGDWFCQGEGVEAIRLLLSYGADIMAVDSSGNTALDLVKSRTIIIGYEKHSMRAQLQRPLIKRFLPPELRGLPIR